MHTDSYNSGETPEFLLAALEQAIDAVVIIDSNNNVTHFNAAAERLWGYSRDEVLGRNVSCLVPAHIQAHHNGYIEANRATGVNRIVGTSREVKITRKDGVEIWGALSMSRVAIDNEIIYMGFVRDVTVEVRQREALALHALVAARTTRMVIVTDHERRIAYGNEAFFRVFGYTASESIGRLPSELLAGRYTDQATLERLRRQTELGNDVEEEILVYTKAGSEIWVSAAISAVSDGQGKLKNLVMLLTDITEGKQLQSLQRHVLEALALETPIRDVFDMLCRRVEIIAPDVVSSVLRVDGDGLVHPLAGPNLPAGYCLALDGLAIGPDVGSCGAAAALGVPVLAQDIATDSRWLPYKDMPLAAGLRACWSSPIKARDGRVIGTFAFYFREARAPNHWHQKIVDACVHLCALAIEREESRNQIARLAYHDMLTGLPNRAHLRQLTEQAIEDCPADEHIALIFIDLDHFKDVNDTLGHSVGDELLVGVTQRLMGQTRPGDVLSRLGGDEFILMLSNCDAEGAATIARRITDVLAVPMRLGGRTVPVSASMGISVYPDNATDIDSLMKHADAAMYKAKQAGRSTHRVFTVDMNVMAEQRLTYVTALRSAIAQGHLKLHYQPQIRTDGGALYGVEALARWYDPVLGEVPPSKFIPLAEECGLIEQIGIWSMREACRQIALWRNAGLDVPCVSVNLSPLNFHNANLATVVAGAIQENGLSPETLMLEITEGVILDENSAAVRTMDEVRKLGVGLSLDDFGTGYSSLSRLAHLPIRELKIDRSFMNNIETDAGARAITTAVIRVGQSLKMSVVAEGVETEGQRRLLAELGCDVVQGFLHAPALAPVDFERWLIQHCVAQAYALLREVGRSLSTTRLPERTLSRVPASQSG
ncbi:EAL domain-containing protein [Bradyrhizobium sp. dw_411]|uniref:EAL domain-containing protein n=1 Tax=Bradyrhizobium sp. dw_411 TaxID=2720082 RepID=UPI001BD0DD09|nr:EAL domain-containing protein [Bradyrhizobium sp. dw_411]